MSATGKLSEKETLQPRCVSAGDGGDMAKGEPRKEGQGSRN